MQVEQRSYTHPWTRTHFADSVKAGHRMQLLYVDNALIGYYVAMHVVDEAHLLNITVKPESQSKGFGRLMLEHLFAWANEWACASVLLEVRASNQAAIALYKRVGFVQIGQRKNYYPLRAQKREDAVVMRFVLPNATLDAAEVAR